MINLYLRGTSSIDDIYTKLQNRIEADLVLNPLAKLYPNHTGQMFVQYSALLHRKNWP